MKKNSVLSNVIWRIFERAGSLGVGLIISIILARIIDPTEFGLVAITQVFVSFFTIIVDGGFGNALIQKKDADDLDFSSVFYFNVFLCLVLYSLVFLFAPLIASFFRLPSLVDVLRLYGIVLIIGSLQGVQQAYVSRTMQFKLFFFSTLGGTIGSGGIGVWMAYHGFGVWALVMQALSNSLINTGILWFTVKWRPKKLFSFVRLKALFSYGSKLMLSTILFSAYADIRQLIIGKFYSTTDIAFYNRASLFSSTSNSIISRSLNTVLFAVMSSEQDDRELIVRRIKFVNQIFSFIMMPCLIGMCVCSDTIIKTFFTEKWYSTIPYLRILSLTYMLDGLGISNLNALKAIGFSGITLRIEIKKSIVYLLLLIIAIPYGVEAIALSFVIGVYFSELLIAYQAKKIFRYPLLQQLKDISVFFAMSVVMGICVYFVGKLSLPYAILLFIQTLAGICIYMLGAYVLRLEQFFYLLYRIKAMTNK